MSDPATTRFFQDYMAYNKSLKIPHPYFQQIQYVKINSMIIKEVLKRKHERILDAGSGEGHLVHGLSAISNDCVALDIEAERLASLERKNPKIKCVQANVESGLPFKSNFFDAIIASELLEHLNSPRGFYKEVSRVLKNTGIFILTTPNCDNLANRLLRRLPQRTALSLAKKAGADLMLHPELAEDDIIDRHNPHLHKVEGYTRKQLQLMGKEQGLKTVFYRSFGLPVPDSAYSRLPKGLTRFIVNHMEDHIPYALRHLIVYENK